MTEPSVPAAVTELAAGEPTRLVWHNEAGGLTYEAGTGARRRFIKWAPADAVLDLPGEADRLRWAFPYTPVPRLLDQGECADGTWIVTAALPGLSAVEPRWQADPGTAVRAIGAGLRAMHEALPVDSCPFSWRADDRVAVTRRLVDAGTVRQPSQWDPSHQHLSMDQALTLIAGTPPVDRLVVCHGDSCAPNTLIGDDGRWTAHVDLDALGVADRWADLAVATWSTTWNYGPGWEKPLLDAYGIAPDEERTRYYRLLWDLDP